MIKKNTVTILEKIIWKLPFILIKSFMNAWPNCINEIIFAKIVKSQMDLICMKTSWYTLTVYSILLQWRLPIQIQEKKLHIQWNLSKLNLQGTNFCVQNRQVFILYWNILYVRSNIHACSISQGVNLLVQSTWTLI